MIIKSHIRGGYRDAAAYLKEQGENETIRTLEISDAYAKDLDEAFKSMWVVASQSRVKKPLHHISINPHKDERLTDEQVLRIVERCEDVYGYKPNEHQRVIVEHIKEGRQHFHVMWNRVSLETGKAVWPGLHWNKSKQVSREMEKELGLKRPSPKQARGVVVRPRRHQNQNAISHYPIKYPQPRKILSSRPTMYREVPERPSEYNFKPVGNNLGGMSKAQRMDFLAACDGKITWRQYFQKWGNPAPWPYL